MLKTVLETLDGVDDAVKTFYAETDGKFILKVDGVDSHPDVANLKTAYERVKADRDKLRQERDDATAKLKSVPDDFDPEKWARAKEGKADPQQLAQLRQTLEAERDEWKGKFEGIVAESRQKAIRDAVQKALADSGVPEGARRGAALDMMDGRKVDLQGEMPTIDTDMGPMPVAEYAKRWVSKDGAAYVPKPSGGDAKGNNGTGTSGNKPGEMSAQERAALFKQNPEEFYRLFPQAKLR
jgi:hypothetical protein